MFFHFNDADNTWLYYLHGNKFSEIGNAAVHQVAHRLIVYTHNITNIIILPLLHIIKVYYLLLARRESCDALHQTAVNILFFLYRLKADIVFFDCSIPHR